MKSNIALVAFATEYILLKELLTFKKSTKNKTMQTPNNTCPNTIFLLKYKNARIEE
jgi:hypothetical protein